MSAKPRYLFALPDMQRPVGGVNVALDFLEILAGEGYDVAALYGAADYRYPTVEPKCPTYFSTRLAALPRQFMGRKGRLKDSLARAFKPKGPPVNQPFDLRPEDVFVIPEFRYPEYSDLFPDNRRILLAQDVFGLARAFLRDSRLSQPWISRFDAYLTTSEVTREAIDYLAGVKSRAIPLSVPRAGLSFRADKKRQIAYMPRKRGEEVKIVVEALKPRLEKLGWQFAPIHNLPRDKSDAVIRESLIFLSFSHQEGFGLPPAEAMATGAIAVGYTGVGGEEYFRSANGIPVPDCDVIGFAKAVEETALEYDRDPARLDAMRKSASDYIHAHYAEAAMASALKAAWREIDQQVTGA